MKSGDAAIRTINGAPVLHFGVAEDQGIPLHKSLQQCEIGVSSPSKRMEVSIAQRKETVGPCR